MSEVLESFSAQYQPQINQKILVHLRSQTEEPRLLEAMEYSVQAGGKRIRPLLLLATVDFFDDQIDEDVLAVAGAIEMVHTYSLIHDDLPAMDNDELRRGKATNHKVFGEGLAILAGDALLTEAFQLLTKNNLTSDEKSELVLLLAKASGAKGMIAGQVADLAGEERQLSLKELEAVHQRKTGALIEFAVVAGVLLTKQKAEVQKKMKEFAYHFGLAFQIRDDLLDVIGKEEEIGKPTGSDLAQNKSTYTSLLGINEAQSKLNYHFQQGLRALDSVNPLEKDNLLALIFKSLYLEETKSL